MSFYAYSCVTQPDLCEDLISFDKIDIKMFKTSFTLQSDSMVICPDATNHLNHKIEASRLTFLHVVKSEVSGECLDLLVHEDSNPAVVTIKLNSNEVPVDLSIKIEKKQEDEIHDEVIVYFMDSATRQVFPTTELINFKEITDKNIALVFRIKLKPFAEIEKRVLGKILVTGKFLKNGKKEIVMKTLEHSLVLSNPAHLRFSFESFHNYYNFQLDNVSPTDLKIISLKLKGRNGITIEQIVEKDMILQRGERYSMIHDNSLGESSVPLGLVYSIDSSIIVR